ncbi:MAG: GDSL-type esterase/lipase family protein [Alphaproteobacteria bacterium]
MRIALIVSVVLNLVLAASVFGVWAVGPMAVTQLEDVAEREQRISLHELTPISQGDIVLAGDDMLARGPWGDVFRHYTVFLRNRAIVGENCIQLRERLNAWTQHSTSSENEFGRVLIISCGANDLAQKIEERRSVHALAAMLDLAAAKSPSTRVVVVGLVPQQGMAQQIIAKRNSALKAVAAARNISFINLTSSLGARDGGLQPIFATPLGRLNGEGYRLIAERLAPYLRP